MSQQRFTDQHVFIFGGNSGIGLAAARAFTAEGARVAITGRNIDTLQKAAAEIGALALRSDIASPEDSRRALTDALAQNGPIDVLFVNAGIGGFAPIAEVSEAFWDAIHSVNLRGAFFAAQAAAPHMKDGGAIIFTGSVGSCMAIPGNAAYAAAKAGVRALVRIFAIELLGRKIRVNMVSPGPTETPIIHRNIDFPPEAIDGLRQAMIDNTPMKRIADPDEIARPVLFLASSEASFITGVDLFADGGMVEVR